MLGTNEYLVGTPDGVCRAWAIRRLSAEDRWSGDRFLAVRGTHLLPTPGSGRYKPRIRTGDQEHLDPKDRVGPTGARGVYFKASDFAEHGYTADCPGCRHLRSGARPFPHTPACRERMLDCLAKSEEGRRRIAETERRVFEEDEARMEEQEKRKRKAQEEEEARKEPRKEEATQGDQEPQPHHGDIRGEHHAASSDGTTRGAPPIAPKRFYVEQDSDEEPWPHLSQKKARV